jgi:hypothetical protein
MILRHRASEHRKKVSVMPACSLLLLIMFTAIIKAIITARKSEQPSKEDIEDIIAEVSHVTDYFSCTDSGFGPLAQIETQHKGCLAAYLFLTMLCTVPVTRTVERARVFF